MAIKRGGRKSSAELSTPKPLDREERPAAPPQLTPPEADVWAAHVNSQPAEWFQSEANRRMLTQLCRHSVQADRVAQLMDAECAREVIDAEAIDALAKQQERESRMIATLSTKLRLTPQSRYVPDTAARKARQSAVSRPWDE